MGDGGFDVVLAAGASVASAMLDFLFARSDIARGRSLGRSSPNSSPRGRDQRELRERGSGRSYVALTLGCPD